MNNKIALFILTYSLLFLSLTTHAQSSKASIYGEVGLGVGQTLFFGDMQSQLQKALGGEFRPGIGNNLMMGFYFAPEKWKGLGIGSRIRGTFGASVKGEYGDSYIFNYYNLALAIKYYPIGQTFNKGAYLKGSVGFGQFTSKREQESSNLYLHQYAIGSSLIAGLGYSIAIKKVAISLELEFTYSNRNGTIDGIGNATFQSGQLGANLVFSF